MADYTGTFNGSFTGSFTGDLVGVDYYDLENSPPTITPHQANQITANSNFRENFKANLNAQGLISSSAQVDYGSVSNIPSGIVSSSQQTKDYLPSGVVSSSQQTKDYLPSGTVSSSVQVDYGSISNIPNDIVSSSAQIISNLEGQSLSVATLTAETYILSSSVTNMTTLFSSGSTMFGDDINDTHQFTGSMFVSGSFINNGLTYPLVDGESGRVIVTDGNGNLTFGDGERLVLEVRNDSTGSITVGCPVYSKGEIGGSNRILVDKADASDPTKMPAIGVLQQTLNTTDNKDGFAVVTGILNTNISGFTGLTKGQIVYVKGGGDLTTTKPTGSDLIQNVGIILKTNGSTIQGLKVSAIGRANDVPNITPGYTWVGNADGVATPTPTSSFSSGSFSGSFEGDGSGLTNVPASGVVGLNLTRISTTNVTASVSEGTDTFKITSGSETPFKIGNDGVMTGTGSGLIDLDATETNIQTTILSNQNVGGISSGESFAAGTDVEDILRQILIQFIPSDINSLLLRNNSSNVSTGVREVNSAITTDEFRITVSQNDPNLLTPINLSLTGSGGTSGNFENYYGTSLSDGTNDITISPDEVLNINTIPSANSANITITARAEDPTDGSILSTSRNYSYVYPFYYGATSTDLSSATGTTLETYLTKLTQTKGTKSVTLVATSEYLYFGYPSRYGDLSKIEDGNNFDVTSNFTKYTITIDGGNGWNSVSYYLYRSTTTTTITSQTYTFTF